MTRIAVVGFGYWGKNLIRNFYELGTLSVVCDADDARQIDVENQYPGVQFTTSFDDVLADGEIDAVVLATPAVTHASLAEQVLSAGKDCFVEKPLSLSVPDGERLTALAETHQRILMVGHILHYHPAIIALKELITEGKLGRIDYIYSNRLNIGKFRTEENILWSFAPHDISVILGILDEEPDSIDCQGASYVSSNIADVTMTQMAFRSGAKAHIHVSWLHPFKEQRLVIVGSEQMAVFDDTAEDKLVLYPHKVNWQDRIPTAVKADAVAIDLPESEPLKQECRAFLDSINTRIPPLTDGKEGLRVLKVLAASQKQLESPARKPNAEESPTETQLTKDARIHRTAEVDHLATIGSGTSVWHYSHVMNRAVIGNDCSIGQNCCISPEVTIGDRVKIQNNVSVYTGTIVEDDVFLGPSCVLTNVSNPRSQVSRKSIYETTTIRRGATVGANATIVCGIEIGQYSFVAAGAVVTRDVPDYALMVGNPARQTGWMSRHGHKLPAGNGTILTCPESGLRYKENAAGQLTCLDISESDPLPSELASGSVQYREVQSRTIKARLFAG
jgi:UDP-2-acetamido-3-amino-2,3-dideoxy-glucuronate N-acetyltransferase